MKRSRSSLIALTVATALVLGACGSGDGDSGNSDESDIAQSDEEGDVESDTTGDDDADGDDDDGGGDDGGRDDGDGTETAEPPVPADGDFAVPVAKFAADGPEAANTIAPSCGTGNLDHGGDLLRFTPPADFNWKGTSGGSGHDEIEVLGPDDVSLIFTEAALPGELGLVDGYAVVGPTGTEVTINDTAIPVVEVTLEGATAYALVDLPYLDPLPLITEGTALATAIVSSDTDGRPTLEEAAAILETVRVERCAAISQAMIYAAGGGFAPVPRFEPDPLGKTWPDEPQPAIVGLPSLDVYSVEQLAYLMPVEADRATCAAETALAEWADNPIGYLLALTPSGTQHEDFDAVIADC